MMVLLFFWMMIIISLQPGSSKDLLTPFKDVLLGLEGEDVTLSCNYSGSVNFLFWYRQMFGLPPELLTSGYSDTTGRFSLKHEKPKNMFHLLISSPALTDSAVYYCAVKPTVTRITRTLYKNMQYYKTSTRGPQTLLNYFET